MLDREQLETFATIADERSFDRAASVLSITRGAVSLRIKALEEALGTVLLVRDKPVAPTRDGEILLRHVKALRLMEASTLGELRPGPKDGGLVPLSIAVNADSLATWFAEVLWTLLLQGKAAVEVLADDQDHTSEMLLRGEVAGCISTKEAAASGFIASALGAMEYRCYANPGFARAYFPEGLTVQSVLRAPAVLFNRKDALHDEFLRKRFGVSIERYAKHYLPAPLTLLEGIAVGAGYGLIPYLQAEPVVSQGRLVELAPETTVQVELYWHHWEFQPALLGEITGLVVREGRRLLGYRPVAEEAAR